MSQWPAIAEIAKSVAARRLKASDMVERSLAAVEAKKAYKTVIAPTTERARQRAGQIDNQISRGGKAGMLAGVPFIAKDNFLCFGADTTAASNMLKGFSAPYQSTAVDRLEAAGAICVAKANLDAFAHGSSTENSDFFTSLNPYDKSRVPGGSSGGSAAAVALDIAPFALGTDTGGSIRLPAAFCGVVGYKPTYGLVSRSGVVAMASSTDVVGPLAKRVEDAALVVDAMSGKDRLDGTTIDKDIKGYNGHPGTVKGKKVGLIKEYLDKRVEPGVKLAVDKALKVIKKAGAEVSIVSLASLPHALAAYYIICPAEVSSNLSRYDGQRYGYSYAAAKDLKDSYIKSRSLGLNQENKRRIMIGTYVLSSGYYDTYYKQAQTVRTRLINDFASAYKQFDFLIGPTAATTAFKIGSLVKNPLSMYLTDIMTVASNLTGEPAISMPAGMSNGLPVGLQIMAAQHHDRQLLQFAKAVESLL